MLMQNNTSFPPQNGLRNENLNRGSRYRYEIDILLVL
jgi:hypothetical protein